MTNCEKHYNKLLNESNQKRLLITRCLIELLCSYLLKSIDNSLRYSLIWYVTLQYFKLSKTKYIKRKRLFAFCTQSTRIRTNAYNLDK